MSFIYKIKRSFLRWLLEHSRSTKPDTKEYMIWFYLYEVQGYRKPIYYGNDYSVILEGNTNWKVM